MDVLFKDFALAHSDQNGYRLASTLSPQPPAFDPARLYTFIRSTSSYSIVTDLRYKLQYNPDLQLDKSESAAWIDVFTVWHAFVSKLIAAEELQNTGKPNEADWSGVYDGWKDVVSALSKGYSNGAFGAWTLPCIYIAGKFLRVFAIKADERIASQQDSGLAFGGLDTEDAFDPSSQNEKLEDAARQINRLFSLCINDRNPLTESRKWGAYNIANLLFKIYFKLNSVSLCKNIIRSLTVANTEMPELSQFPKSDQVTFKYYNGVLAFLEEDYPTAEEHLTEAYLQCNAVAAKNIQLILTYLIPTRLLTTHHLPTQTFLSSYPEINRWFSPIRNAVLKADLIAFNTALEKGEDEFVKRRIYLTLERGRDIIIRNILRKVFLAGGFEEAKEGDDVAARTRRTRIPIKEFSAALKMAGAEVGDGNGGIDGDEVECLIANTVYKGFMKGYIARERGMVVLSKAGAFPSTGI